MCVLKRKSVFGTIPAAEAEAYLKTMNQLIEAHWKFEISSQVANDLSINRWNKITIVPLATDLKLFKEYLLLTAEAAAKSLKSNKDQESYIVLLETIFCRVIPLNWRRPGELQRLLLRMYNNSAESSENYEEFSDIITASEKILMAKLKRVVIRGKRGRGVPVLFNIDVQDHINIILENRKEFVSSNNEYLFANPNGVGTICGYKVLKKHAVACGAKNPQAMTATKLRKHLATLTQIFSMSESDIEQLAFMGHTIGVHRLAYRLPVDVYQAAKISKLLLLMEKGTAANYKGKTLEEINIDLNEDLMELTILDDDENDNIHPLPEIKINALSELPGPSSSCIDNTAIQKAKRVLVPWTDEQKRVVDKYFSEHIKKKPPKKHKCLDLKQKNFILLQNKDWLKISVCAKSIYEET